MTLAERSEALRSGVSAKSWYAPEAQNVLTNRYCYYSVGLGHLLYDVSNYRNVTQMISRTRVRPF
jgi:hypothetical protein